MPRARGLWALTTPRPQPSLEGATLSICDHWNHSGTWIVSLQMDHGPSNRYGLGGVYGSGICFGMYGMPRWIKALLTKSQQMRPRQHDGAGCSSRACLPQCHLHGRKQGNAQLNDIAHGYPISRQLARLSRQGLNGNRLNCDNCPSDCSVRQPETLLSSEKQSQGAQRIILQEIHRVTKIRPAFLCLRPKAWQQRYINLFTSLKIDKKSTLLFFNKKPPLLTSALQGQNCSRHGMVNDKPPA